MRFPPLIRGCSYIGLPQVLGLKPCGTGGFTACLSRRRGALKLQVRGRSREDTVVEIQLDHMEQKPLLFTGLPHFGWILTALSGRIWCLSTFFPALSRAILDNALVPRRCAKFVVQYHCATNANRCSDPTLKQFTALRIQIFTLN